MAPRIDDMFRAVIEPPTAGLTGQAPLDDNGGSVRMAVDFNSDDTPFEARHWSGIELDVNGHDERQEVRLRAGQLRKPRPPFRAAFQADSHGKTVPVPFGGFARDRHDLRFDPAHLCWIGRVVMGRAFQADVTVLALRLYRQPTLIRHRPCIVSRSTQSGAHTDAVCRPIPDHGHSIPLA